MLRGGTCSALAMAGTAVFRMVVSTDSRKNATATNHGRSHLLVSFVMRSNRRGSRQAVLSPILYRLPGLAAPGCMAGFVGYSSFRQTAGHLDFRHGTQ